MTDKEELSWLHDRLMRLERDLITADGLLKYYKREVDKMKIHIESFAPTDGPTPDHD